MTHDLRKSTDSAPCTRGRGSPTVKDGGAAWQCSDREHHGRVAHFKFPFSFGIFFSPNTSYAFSTISPAVSLSPSSLRSLFLTAPSLCLLIPPLSLPHRSLALSPHPPALSSSPLPRSVSQAAAVTGPPAVFISCRSPQVPTCQYPSPGPSPAPLWHC